MRDYRRMMEQVTLSDRKKEEIMDMLENQGAQKRRRPSVRAMVLAAALAVGCVLSIAAGLPGQVYNFVAGGTTTVMPGTGDAYIELVDAPISPVTVEHDRLWFEADGERVDITDKVDANTPYIYERTDPATGQKGYVVAGGTIDDYGWAEFFMTEDGTCSMVGENFADSTIILGDGRELAFAGLPEGEFAQIKEGDGFIDLKSVNRPWLDAALAQLDMEVD